MPSADWQPLICGLKSLGVHMNQRQSSVDTRQPLPYANGWFAICFSHELKQGAVLALPFMGQELVVYRTRSGQVRTVDPYCPHLGAHLGHGGKVEGENLVCPFHGLAFNPEGHCIRTGIGQKPPCAKLPHKQTRESNGVVLVWNSSGGYPPDWEIPELDTTGFSLPAYSRYDLAGYAQDMIENSADMLHFAWVHGFTDVAMSHQTDSSKMELNLSARWRGVPLHMHVTSHGLGYVLVKSQMPRFGVQVKTRGFATQTRPLEWTFRWSDIVRVAYLDRFPAILRKPAYALLIKLAHLWFVRVVSDDFPIWNNRRYVVDPKLIAGEGALMAYRRWASQFYPHEVEPQLDIRGAEQTAQKISAKLTE